MAQAEEGLENRFLHLRKLYGWTEEEEAERREVYHDRLKFELKVINDMEYPGYFLIVSDFIKWSKKEHIP
ncbi:MAG: hypothetical protein GY866_20150, partial [Proteobacteria bacterium]|nr:hypothetical protein [Pseudomonadota bacterium]